MKIRVSWVLSTCLLFGQSVSYGAVYNSPVNPRDSVIVQYPDEEIITDKAIENETLLDVARRFLLGQTEIVRLNQDLDRWLVKKGQDVKLPNKRILPDSPHDGITLNIAEYRMYFYPENSNKIYSFAHGVGRQDWKTPLGKTSVQKKVKDPVWHPPESIRREHAAMGDPLPEIVPPGPHNPLGAFALYLNLPGEYRIHGTDIDKIYGIGMQITHGCVRMYPEDIAKLYYMVDTGTPVYIVKQPIKVGWLNDVLYVEAHPDLEGEEMTQEQRYASALALIQKANNYELPDFDQGKLNDALAKQTGDPVAIYERPPTANDTNSENLSIAEPLEDSKPVLKTAAPVAKLANAKSSKTSAKSVKKASIKKAVAKVVSKATTQKSKKDLSKNFHHY